MGLNIQSIEVMGCQSKFLFELFLYFHFPARVEFLILFVLYLSVFTEYFLSFYMKGRGGGEFDGGDLTKEIKVSKI